MPGPHGPPAGPLHQARRQDHPYYHHLPPPTHSPVPPNPYAQYHHHPQPYGASYGYPMPQMPPQWAPYHHAPPPPPQYAMPPRQFQPHASPVVVSSHPHMAAMPPVNRAMGQTPPIVHSHTPPAPRIHTPQPAPSTPSAHSHSHTHLSASTPPTINTASTPPPVAAPKPAQPATSRPFAPPLPWLSVPGPFPPRAAGRRRRRKAPVPAEEEALELPSRGPATDEHVARDTEDVEDGEQTPTEGPAESLASTAAVPSDVEVDTPSTSHPPSEVDLAPATAPAAAPASVPSSAPATKHTRTATIPAIPLIPIKSAKAPSATSTTQPTPVQIDEGSSEAGINVEDTPKASPKPAAPKSWAELLRAKNAPAAAQAPAAPTSNGVVPAAGPTAPKSNTLADVLASFSVDSEKKVSFIEPRGLVNTGNLCYMNSILQVLLFCVPFYDFLDQVAKRAVHSFKSETPLVDALIMFMRDFKLIDSAATIEQLRLRLKDNELEQYGDPLTPEYVYDVIRRLPRFDNMKRGQQEDAEEFLGFLLAGLHDEAAHIIKSDKQSQAADGVASPSRDRPGSVDSGWQEVGAKQKSANTQSSGAIEFETPITKIFGGKLRSEYKKPGEKASVTLEPYQPLQLDIGEPNINNISDALKNLTRLETLDGAARGARASTKQVHIESLPPVLILHLKRFHYDAHGPQKIWKKVGYPLELEIPKDVFPPPKRNSYLTRGAFPRYRLISVVYHHGKNASGGHYTVDLRRQEGREWVRMDDTVIRRIRAEDVAEGGAEEDPKVLAAALEQHKNDAGKSKNFFAQIDMHEEEADQGAWSQVNGTEKKENPRKWTGVVNGTATPNSAGKRTPMPKENVRDNKVAYILFYQRIET
ncbi:hypothetical protein BDU57DRAFT_520318 [Ampelomyces quisqualis]|uniref:Ubiquitin carboxyl-terminal hydrolase n=1 Tax=Ampelomyces quisqualis TaxID=50730 RepID=A0A6A5QDP2_AMPQU|nr:hypothetical protein BDU57DRAFT_520318 [Ampelomyces quisqualis]